MDKKLTIAEHFYELKRYVTRSVLFFVLSFAGCYFFAEDIYGFLTQPLVAAYGSSVGRRLIYTSLTEAFFTYIKLSMYVAILISTPFAMNQVYSFIAPALYKKERRLLLPYLVFGPILFCAGGALVFFFIIPTAWQFFVGFETLGGGSSLPIQLEAKVSEYLSLTLQLIFAFGLAFQLPIILKLITSAGVVSRESIASKRRYIYIALLSFSALLTPPDIVSQIGLTLPLIALFEVTLLTCKKAA